MLQISVKECSNFQKDELGRETYTVTVLGNLDGCWGLLRVLNWQLEGYFDRCGTHNIYSGALCNALKTLIREQEETDSSDYEKHRLSLEIKQIKKFFRQVGINKQVNREFEISIFW